MGGLRKINALVFPRCKVDLLFHSIVSDCFEKGLVRFVGGTGSQNIYIDPDVRLTNPTGSMLLQFARLFFVCVFLNIVLDCCNISVVGYIDSVWFSFRASKQARDCYVKLFFLNVKSSVEHKMSSFPKAWAFFFSSSSFG